MFLPLTCSGCCSLCNFGRRSPRRASPQHPRVVYGRNRLGAVRRKGTLLRTTSRKRTLRTGCSTRCPECGQSILQSCPYCERRSSVERKIGEAACLQVAEALCILVASRTWADAWKLLRCVFKVRSDLVSTLSLLPFCGTEARQLGVLHARWLLILRKAYFNPA